MELWAKDKVTMGLYTIVLVWKSSQLFQKELFLWGLLLVPSMQHFNVDTIPKDVERLSHKNCKWLRCKIMIYWPISTEPYCCVLIKTLLLLRLSNIMSCIYNLKSHNNYNLLNMTRSFQYGGWKVPISATDIIHPISTLEQ